MGTNYYFHERVCPACRHAASVDHIGKSSGGWTFSFRGYRADYEQPKIDSYAAWLEYFAANTGEIRDEYGAVVSVDEFKKMVEAKRQSKNNHTLYCREHHPEYAKGCWLDPDGHSFTGTEFS